MKFRFLILLYFISTSAVAQVSDLLSLSTLPDNLNLQSLEQDNQAENNNQELNKEGVNGKTNQKKDFTNDSFGYTGGQDFNNRPRSKFPDRPLEHFGYSFFYEQPSTFAPFNNAPIPPDYLIGIDDNIRIVLYGSKSATYN